MGKRRIISLGQHYNIDGKEYILALVDFQRMGLICLKDGNRWNDPVEIADFRNVTASEFQLISAGGRATYIKD